MAAPRRIRKIAGVKQFDRMAKARTRILLDQPFFATLLLKLRLIESEDIPTAATNGEVIMYNPDFIKSITDAQTVGLIAHELMHCVFQHMTRRGHRNPRKWNRAGDYVINPGILNSGMQLPPGGLLDERYEGKTTEEVYAMLPDEAEDSEPLNPEGFPGPSSGTPTDWVFDSSAKTPAEKQRQQDDWTINLQQAVNNAKNAGKIPAGFKELIDSFGAPTINWRVALRRFFTGYSKRDYSWAKCKRRLIGQNIYLPSLHSEDLEDLVIGVDTSGSVSKHELELFSAELNDILQGFDATITVIYCDAEVQAVDTYDTDVLPRDLRNDFPGRGGTELRPIFEYIEEHNLRPSCMVYFTDGGIYDSRLTAPDYPFLTITTDAPLKFGDNIKMET
jgi:predicted metal-dependent peptidase